MKKLLLNAAAAFAIAVLTLTTYAEGEQGNSDKGMDKSGMKMASPETSASESMSMSDGEVEAVDKTEKTITLKHGPIKSKTIEMDAMTMMFFVQDPSLLSNVKEGDKVKFTVEYIDNAPVVTSLSVVK